MLCPLCNGIDVVPVNCASCGGQATECGRLSDWTGPYEPYGQLPDSLQSGAAQHAGSGYCCHVVYCENCSRISEWLVAERPLG